MDGQLLSKVAFDLPNGAAITSIEDGPQQQLIARWISKNEHGWSLYDRDSGQVAARNHMIARFSELRPFTQSRAQWGNPASAAEIAFDREQLQLFWPNPSTPSTFAFATPIDVVAMYQVGERVLFIGRGELYEFNLSAALRVAMRR